MSAMTQQAMDMQAIMDRVKTLHKKRRRASHLTTREITSWSSGMITNMAEYAGTIDNLDSSELWSMGVKSMKGYWRLQGAKFNMPKVFTYVNCLLNDAIRELYGDPNKQDDVTTQRVAKRTHRSGRRRPRNFAKRAA